MPILKRFFQRRIPLCQEEMARPYCERARQALLGEDLLKAIAILDCGIRVAPEYLELYLQRAQIFQYGLEQYSRALEDYRHILRRLESKPNNRLAQRCKQAMRDMMTLEVSQSS